MKCIGYVRVSTEEQSREGVSIEAQIAKLKAYAALYEIELVDIIVDAGYSAKSLKREKSWALRLTASRNMSRRFSESWLTFTKMGRFI